MNAATIGTRVSYLTFEQKLQRAGEEPGCPEIEGSVDIAPPVIACVLWIEKRRLDL
jgi:hypothetical protein